MTFKHSGIKIVTSIYVIALITTMMIFFTLLGDSLVFSSFWISLIAILIAETAIWYYSIFVIGHVDDVKKSVPGYMAIGVVVVLYWLAVILYSFFRGIAHFALGLYVSVHIVTLVTAIILCGLLMLFIRYNSKHEQNTKFHIAQLYEIESALKQVQIKMKSVHSSQMEELNVLIARLIEKVHYSDPVTPDSLLYMNQQIMNSISTLDIEITAALSSDHEITNTVIIQYINDIQDRLAARNEQVLISK